jgi:hypothetical protein
MRKDINEYYRALGINPGADPAQIRRAYRQLVQQWHPDLFKAGSPMQTTAEDITKEINEAYEQLYRKGLHKKFRAPVDLNPDSEPIPKTSRGSENSARRKTEAAAQRTRARTKVRNERTAPAPRPHMRSREKRPRSALGGGRFFSRAFLAKAAAGAVIIAASIPIGHNIWGSRSAMPPAVEAVRRTLQLSEVAPSASDAGAPAPAVVQADAAPLRPPNAGVSEIPAHCRGQVPADNDRWGGGRTRSVDPADPASLFRRAESLLSVFEVGDTRAKVLEIQGTPDGEGVNVLRFGSSLVYFKDGLVTNWSDGMPRLRMRSWPAFNTSLLDTFSLGSTRGDVVRAQGQPATFTLEGYYYGSSAVYFDHDRVAAWSEGDVALKNLSMPVLPFFDLDSLAFR